MNFRAVFDFSKVHPEANPFLYDGEGYGNPRVVENSVDIGFDEVHFYTMAGSYSNNSTSHNQPGTLNPDLTAGSTQRWVILPRQTSAMNITAGMHVVIHSKMKAAPPSGTTPVAWNQPPATLFRPVVDATSLPLHYQTRYIAFNDTAPSGVTLPTPWVRTLIQADLVDYLAGSGPQLPNHAISFVSFSLTDDECASSPCTHWYFNSEAVIRSDLNGTDLLWSNLQAECR